MSMITIVERTSPVFPQNLYDYGRGAHISLNLNGTQFSGYDHGSGRHYSGKINGHSCH